MDAPQEYIKHLFDACELNYPHFFEPFFRLLHRIKPTHGVCNGRPVVEKAVANRRSKVGSVFALLLVSDENYLLLSSWGALRESQEFT